MRRFSSRGGEGGEGEGQQVDDAVLNIRGGEGLGGGVGKNAVASRE